MGAKSVHNCTFCPSLRSQPPQPLKNPMFLSQLCVRYNFAAGSNLVRAADYTVDMEPLLAAAAAPEASNTLIGHLGCCLPVHGAA